MFAAGNDEKPGLGLIELKELNRFYVVMSVLLPLSSLFSSQVKVD